MEHEINANAMKSKRKNPPRRPFGASGHLPRTCGATWQSSPGSVLIVVLWVIGLLSMFVMAFAFDMHIESRIASSWRKKLKAEYLAKAGFELARMALLETDDPNISKEDTSVYLSKGSDEELRLCAVTLANGGGADLSRELGEGTISVTIRPENAWMNLNSMIYTNDRELTYETWDPLFKMVGVPRENRDALVDCLIDWVDKNELTHLNGVESDYYESLSPPYQSKNRAMDTVEELVLVKGFNEIIPDTDQTVYEAVSPFLTTYSEDHKININSVSTETLMAFLDIDSHIAEDIIDERLGPDGLEGTDDDDTFKDVNDLLLRVPVLDESIADYITFDAFGRYYIRSSGKVGDLERTISCVIALKDKALTILSWLEGERPDSH